jgi:hypothetical protein
LDLQEFHSLTTIIATMTGFREKGLQNKLRVALASATALPRPAWAPIDLEPIPRRNFKCVLSSLELGIFENDLKLITSVTEQSLQRKLRIAIATARALATVPEPTPELTPLAA